MGIGDPTPAPWYDSLELLPKEMLFLAGGLVCDLDGVEEGSLTSSIVLSGVELFLAIPGICIDPCIARSSSST